MNLENVLKPALVVGPEEKLSHVAVLMAKERKHEIALVDSRFLGIVSSVDLIKRSVNDPANVKISYFVKNVRPYSVDTPIEDIINFMVIGDLKNIPVEKDGKIYMVEKPQLLRFLSDSVLSGRTAADLMSFPFCVDSTDGIDTARTMFRDLGVLRIPVLENDRVVGLLEAVDLLPALIGKERLHDGETVGEKGPETVSVSSFMRTDVLRVGEDMPLKDLAKKMADKSETAAIVEKDGKLSGMVALRDILKLVGRPEQNYFLNVSGLKGEDPFIKGLIEKMIKNSLQKISKQTPISYFAVNVDKMQKGGERTNYTVRGRFSTGRGTFYAESSEWDLTKAFKEFLEMLEREIKKRSEKMRKHEAY